VDRLWDFFCSLKLTIITLILLALTSIIGTVIEQGTTAAEFATKSGWSLPLLQFLDRTLNVFDMYHSWWFLSLMGLFAVNLICCSIKRFPLVWKTVHNPVLIADDGLFRTFSNREEYVVQGSMESVKEKVSAFLGERFAPPVANEQDDKIYLFSQKGAYARFGVYITHCSILIIFIGAMIGNVWGYKAYVNVVEGTSVDKVWPRGGKESIPLGFEVGCDEFAVTYYENSMRPKEFMSILNVIDNGEEVISNRKIVVNDPLTYKGITFYQSSYGPAGDPVYRFRVKHQQTGETVEVSGKQGAHLPLPGGGSLIPMGYAESYENFGPAARVSIDSGNHQHGTPFIVLQNYPQFDAKRGGSYGVSLLGADQLYYTGLQVGKDPGVWVVWLGSFLLVAGSMTAFFWSHRRLWVTIQTLENGIGVKFGGAAHRNQPAFALYFDELKKDLNDALAS
jgi:cytochrome c biogenesis protein